MRSSPPATALEWARLHYWERPAEALDIAVRCHAGARRAGDAVLQSRALTLQGAVSMHRGDLRGAFALAAEAERHAGDDVLAGAELASLNTHLHFFSGSYGEAIGQGARAIELADRTGDVALRVHARRMACVAFGNLGVDDWPQHLELLMELSVEGGDPWEQAISHNDLGHLNMAAGEHGHAARHLAAGLELAEALAPHNAFALGVLLCTRSELHVTTGAAAEGLEDADEAIEHLSASGEDVNPYLLGMAVLTKVQALQALDRLDDAKQAAEQAVDRLGDRVPQARGMVLSAVAEALRAAGRAEEAYDAMARSAALEREALQEFSQLQLGLERARLEITAARREADALAEKNRQLQVLQEQLREQADRDSLTGLGNRRYLARARSGMTGAVSLAVFDLDHFKSVNDRFGHQVGDRVLVRVADLLIEQLRSEDVIVRTGGEEFVALMPGTTAGEAAHACERLRAAIAAEPWDAIADGLRLTVSVGVVSSPEPRDITELERVADERLYAAKRAGRDRVVQDAG
jgi:diguanylate cyclase (GGDEF)-like protein